MCIRDRCRATQNLQCALSAKRSQYYQVVCRCKATHATRTVFSQFTLGSLQAQSDAQSVQVFGRLRTTQGVSSVTGRVRLVFGRCRATGWARGTTARRLASIWRRETAVHTAQPVSADVCTCYVIRSLSVQLFLNVDMIKLGSSSAAAVACWHIPSLHTKIFPRIS